MQIQGIVPCLTYGRGNECEMSAVPMVFGEGAETSADKCVRVEDQREVWGEAEKLGRLIGERLRTESNKQ